MYGSLSEDRAARFATLGSSHVLDSAPEPVFDAVARCAAEVSGFPCAAVFFFDGTRRWCKARVGGLPAEWAGDEPPGYYLGRAEAVRAPGGVPVGAVAVLDRRPRRIRAPQARVLAELARLVDALLASRLGPPRPRRRSLVGGMPVEGGAPLLDAAEAIESFTGGSVTQLARRGLAMPDPTGPPAGEAGIAAEAHVLELVARGTPLPVVLDAVLGMIRDRLGLCAAAMLLADDGGRLRVAVHHGAGSALMAALDGLSPDADGPPPAASAARRQTVVIGDLRAGTGLATTAAEAGLGAWWSSPLVSDVDGRVLGTLEVFPQRPGRPHPAGAHALALATQLATVGIERARAEASLAHRATHDDVTGLANRALLRDRLAAPSPGETGLTAIVLCEVGGLQPVRASFGHDVGDDLVTAVADRLRRCVRSGDIACRLGSEEFAVLLDPARTSSTQSEWPDAFWPRWTNPSPSTAGKCAWTCESVSRPAGPTSGVADACSPKRMRRCARSTPSRAASSSSNHACSTGCSPKSNSKLGCGAPSNTANLPCTISPRST